MSKRVVALALAGVSIAAATTFTLADNGADGRADPSARKDRVALASALADNSGASVQRPYDRLADFLPNVGHTSDLAPQSPPFRITDSVVRGNVVEVENDRGFIETGVAPTQGRPGAVITEYEDPAAHWRTLRVRVQVDEVLAGPQTAQLSFYLPLMGNSTNGEDGAAAERALRELGNVVVFSKALPGGPENLDLTRKLPDEPFGLATVSDAGELAFPFAGQDYTQTSQAFMAGLDTLEELRTESRKPSRTKKN